MDEQSTRPAGSGPDASVYADVKHHKRSSQALMGVLLIVVGGIFLLERVGWQWGWNVSFAHLWPVLLIVAGLGIGLTSRESEITVTRQTPDQPATEIHVKRRRVGDGLFLTLCGVLMLLHVNHWLMLQQSWPVFVVAAGVSILFGRRSVRVRGEGR